MRKHGASGYMKNSTGHLKLLKEGLKRNANPPSIFMDGGGGKIVSHTALVWHIANLLYNYNTSYFTRKMVKSVLATLDYTTKCTACRPLNSHALRMRHTHSMQMSRSHAQSQNSHAFWPNPKILQKILTLSTGEFFLMISKANRSQTGWQQRCIA